MLVCYVRIFTKISSKAGQTASILAGDDAAKPVDVELQLITVRRRALHCRKYPYKHGHFVASYPNFAGTDFVYICIRKSTE